MTGRWRRRGHCSRWRNNWSQRRACIGRDGGTTRTGWPHDTGEASSDGVLECLSLARSVRAPQELLVNFEFRESPGHENNLQKKEELFSSIPGSLAMYSCPISTVLANSACSEAL